MANYKVGNKFQFRIVGRLFAHFGQHLRPYKRTLLIAWACMLGVTLMRLAQPWPMKFIIDAILVPEGMQPMQLPFGAESLELNQLVAVVALSVLVIAILSGLLGYGQQYLLANVGHRVIAKIRQQLYRHIQRLSRSFHDAHHSGDLMVRLTGDIQLMRELLVSSVLFLSERSLVLIAMAGIMFWMDWRLALVAISIVPFLALASFYFSGEIRGAAKRQRRKESRTAQLMSETISSIDVVQSFTRETHEEERFAQQHKSSMKAGLKAARLEANFTRLIEVILAVGACGVLWFGVQQVLAGFLTPGDLIVFVSYMRGMHKPIRRLAAMSARLTKASVCGERLLSILETEPDIKDAPDAVTAQPFRGEIRLNEVMFSYKLGTPVLNKVSFIIRAGQTAALVGGSGSGKSTIASLLLRFYDPFSGQVMIDGTDIRKYTLSSLREQITVVPQEAMLFAISIRDNIGYGKIDATDEEVIAAAKKASAHDFIMRLEDGYDTVIAERGASLSAGQRQRIAIARSIIRNTPIIILDEPMRGLDVESEKQVQGALNTLIAGKTCILITHDLKAASDADLVFLMRDGTIQQYEKGSALPSLSNPKTQQTA